MAVVEKEVWILFQLEGSKIGDFSSLLGRITYPTYPLPFGTF